MASAVEAASCALCGLDCGRDPYVSRQQGLSRQFCCMGCMNVYSILEESGVLASGVDVRDTDLFKRSLEMGLIATGGVPRPKKEAAQGGAFAEEKLFHVGGLWCSSCAWLIEHTLQRQPGVLSAEVYFVSDLLKVRYEPQQFPVARVTESLQKLGYTATEYKSEGGPAESERQDLLMRLGIAAFFWVNVMGLNLSVYLGVFDRMPGNIAQLLPFVVMLLSTPVIVYSARPILRLAWRGMLSGVLRMESLLSLGILSAYGYSAVEALRGGNHVYFDIACAITTLVLVGKSIEQGAKHKAAQTIASLHRMLPKKARVLSGGRERFISIEALKPGDSFTVKAGERIPADGVVVEGESEADEALLTGESLPVSKRVESRVVAGSLNLSSPLTVRATTVGRDSTIAQIAGAVERAVSSRSSMERKVDRVSRVFIPSVIVFAVLTAVAWWMDGLPAPEAMLRAVTILVIACPCALGIATPLALTAAVGAASRMGILVRDSRVLESVRGIDTVLLDKTGTVTEEDFALLEAKAEHMPLLAALQSYSEHPLGQATIRRARQMGLDLRPAANVRITKGLGIVGDVDGQHVAIGSRRMFGLADEALVKKAEDEEAGGRTVAFYSIDGEVRGYLLFGSRVRAEAKAVVAGLQERGIEVMLVSGDSNATTRAVARQLGVDLFFAGATPEDKARLVEKLRAQGRGVAMIGDGINDAPALAQSSLGIAMGSGADLAMQAAAMVLLSGNLTHVLDAFDLSRRTVAVVRQNLFWSFFYNIVGIGFAATGLLSPIVAAAAMVVSSLSVVGNSYRLGRLAKKPL